MNSRQTLYVMALHGGIALAVVVAATLLAYHGALDAEAATAIFGAALGLAGASASSIATLAGAVNGKTIVPNVVMQDRERTMQQAVQSATGVAAATPPADVVSDGP